MAATGRPLKRLREEVSCDICLDFFTDPVILGCGYSFCRACAETLSPSTCPHCGAAFDPSRLRTNRSLVPIVELAKQMTEREKAEAEGGEGGREERQRGACPAARRLLCGACSASEEHRRHHVASVEAAAQEVKTCLRKCLDRLMKERTDVQLNKTSLEADSRRASNRITVVCEKTKAEFKKMHEFLDKEKERLLAQVTELQNEIKNKQNEHISALSRKQDFLEDLIWEMEEKTQQPVNEFLQDIGDLLKRYEEREKFQKLAFLSPELHCKVWNLFDKNLILLGAMKHFKANLESGLLQFEGNTNRSRPSPTTPEERCEQLEASTAEHTWESGPSA
ncbi:E3 ubiquitin-protein ligase TRIM7-like [Eublepharis macularius]|uniref:E3 ubiquitin-protein ligase TRIM7-like n=1 Tax=Eublepharis macularius TaxID=481883 RepID=A0AA97J7F5_EUBMA|nr:E3 ubiquitin-protein ligase TRIM7-like [Eublepharis macularius]